MTALAAGLGRANALLPPPPVALTTALGRATGRQTDAAELTKAGGLLFEWAFPSPIRTQLRVAWDRAERAGEGLRLRLSIDPPELAVWPWELLHDTDRRYTFATSASTPLVRFYDQTDRFGAVTDPGTELPIELLLVLPTARDLNLALERSNVEQVAHASEGMLRVRVLEGGVTRADLADALLLGNYRILHFGGHGGFIDGRGYLGLNEPDGAADWLDGEALGRLLLNYRSVRLAVLNACDAGQADDSRALAGLAPQLVAAGIPAVVAMQFPITDKAAATFAREFYKRLCVGDEAGQVDVAAAYAWSCSPSCIQGIAAGPRRCSSRRRPTASSSACRRGAGRRGARSAGAARATAGADRVAAVEHAGGRGLEAGGRRNAGGVAGSDRTGRGSVPGAPQSPKAGSAPGRASKAWSLSGSG